MNHSNFDRDQFITDADWGNTLFKSFELREDVTFWVKDLKGRFIKANRNFLIFLDLKNENELFGKTDYDLWPEELAVEYIKDDNVVLQTKNRV